MGKSGPLERAQLANQIQGFRIPDRSDAWENNKYIYPYILYGEEYKETETHWNRSETPPNAMKTQVIHTTRKGKSILLFYSNTNSYNNVVTQCHVAWSTSGSPAGRFITSLRKAADVPFVTRVVSRTRPKSRVWVSIIFSTFYQEKK